MCRLDRSFTVIALAVVLSLVAGTAQALVFYPANDSYTYQPDPDRNYGDRAHMEIRNRYGAGGVAYFEHNSFISFDLSSIPPGTPITTATLRLYYYGWKDNDPEGRDLNLYRVTGDWSEETLTYATEPPTAAAVTCYSIVPPGFGWMTWDVTDDVEAFVDGSAVNYGWKVMDEEPWMAINIPITFFYAKENGSLIPYLEVNEGYRFTIEDDYSYPQDDDYDYGLASPDIDFSEANPSPGDPVTVSAHIHNYGLCKAIGGWGWYSPTGRSSWGEWDFDCPASGSFDISWRCRDNVPVHWRLELDGIELVSPVVPGTGSSSHWKIVTLHDVPVSAGPHTVFLGTYQMDSRPDYHVDWIEIGDLHIEGEDYDRMGGNDPNPDWRGLFIRPMDVTTQIWDGDPVGDGVLLCKACAGDINTVIDHRHEDPGNVREACYIRSGGEATLQCEWIPSEPGLYEICVVIDPAGELDEIDEANNVACTRIPVPDLSAEMDVDPDVLNPGSRGRWITCYIELEEGYDPEDIDVSTVVLNNTTPAEMYPTEVGDYDGDGIPDRMVKFSRRAVIDLLPGGEHVEVWVGGEIGDHYFLGMDTIRVLTPKITYPNGGENLAGGETCEVAWEPPPGCEPDWYSLYYTIDNGLNWDVIAANIIETNCSWIAPAVESDACAVMVEAYDSHGLMGYDLSDGNFSVSTAAWVSGSDQGPTNLVLYPTEPSPTKGFARIRFHLPEQRHVKLTVHDVSGRVVRHLLDEPGGKSSHTVLWDGRDNSGVILSEGIYFARLRAGNDLATAKIIYIR
jgi:hypothetical protein